MEYRYYIPNKHVKLGIKIWIEMFQDLISSRELMWRLFIRDFLAKYKQTVFGMVWAFIMPLVMVGTFMVLNKAGILTIGRTDVPYPVFGLLGLTIWQVFATGLTACTNSILQGGGMVVKINFPKEALVVAALAEAIFEFLMRVILLVIVFLLYRILPSWGVLLFPVALIPLVMLTLGLGFLCALLNVLVRDTVYIVTLLTTFLLFLTPVLYPAPDNGLFAALGFYNPLTALVDGPRQLVIMGFLEDPVQYALASAMAVLIFLLSWRIFHLVEVRMAERI